MSVDICVQVFGHQIKPAGRVVAFIDLKCGRCAFTCQSKMQAVFSELRNSIRSFAGLALTSPRVRRAAAKRVYREHVRRFVVALDDVALHARDACDTVKNALRKMLRDLSRIRIAIFGAMPNAQQRQWIEKFTDAVSFLALFYLNADKRHYTLGNDRSLRLQVLERTVTAGRHDGSVVWSLVSKP